VTTLIDLRASPKGGGLVGDDVDSVVVFDGTTRETIFPDDLRQRVAGRAVVLATHGFNVSGEDGVLSLTGWEKLARLPPPFVFIGVLWPGDSRFVPVLDYPIEGGVAVKAGKLLARFIDVQMAGAASISMVSHSLGARVMLECVRRLHRPRVRTLMLMAAAVEWDSLSSEYADSVAKVGRLHVVASREDLVLEAAFPVGNPFTQWLLKGHPLFRKALGREGPARPELLPVPHQVWQLPDGWKFGHGDYMPGKTAGRTFAPPGSPPHFDDAVPDPGPAPWRPGWAALIIATEFC